jgi:maltooligosyltrehalose trehalohydrolase
MVPDIDSLGAHCQQNGICRFLVWAPSAGAAGVLLQLDGKPAVPMTAQAAGYYRLELDGVGAGTRYRYIVNGAARPDPASRFQPEGVHGPSEVVDARFAWTDGDWINPPLEHYIIYELHAGTFSAAGGFEGVIPRLPYLKYLGITAIEIMPVAQFPGGRNWGYDGVFPFAAQSTYGGPAGFQRLVDAAHREGLAVVLDVVYNHLGPEGNYLRDFGPYFTDRYKTPWGDALNFDGPDSDAVRRFFIESAQYWVTDCHVDALRLDAIHAIVDPSARPFVQELAAAVAQRAYVIAESDLNDVRVIRPAESGGLGCDALWNDNFHHSLHVLLTGERDGYYEDFGGVAELAKAYSEGFVYTGQYSPFRRRRYGNSSRGIPGERFVVCIQNHDQIGNRPSGDRLTAQLDFESLKLAAGALLFSANLPLLFMGEEYGETAPFLYFTSHGDAALVEAVRKGRQEEFAAFAWQGEVPDPQAEETFLRCRLTPENRWTASQRLLHEFYRELIGIRKHTPALSRLAMERCEATPLGDAALLVRRWFVASQVLLLLNFSDGCQSVTFACAEGPWTKLVSSSDARWNGGGELPLALASPGEYTLALPARSFVLYGR